MKNRFCAWTKLCRGFVWLSLILVPLLIMLIFDKALIETSATALDWFLKVKGLIIRCEFQQRRLLCKKFRKLAATPSPWILLEILIIHRNKCTNYRHLFNESFNRLYLIYNHNRSSPVLPKLLWICNIFSKTLMYSQSQTL